MKWGAESRVAIVTTHTGGLKTTYSEYYSKKGRLTLCGAPRVVKWGEHKTTCSEPWVLFAWFGGLEFKVLDLEEVLGFRV